MKRGGMTVLLILVLCLAATTVYAGTPILPTCNISWQGGGGGSPCP